MLVVTTRDGSPQSSFAELNDGGAHECEGVHMRAW